MTSTPLLTDLPGVSLIQVSSRQSNRSSANVHFQNFPNGSFRKDALPDADDGRSFRNHLRRPQKASDSGGIRMKIENSCGRVLKATN